MSGTFGFGASGASPPQQPSPSPVPVDVRVQDHGSLVLLFPASDAGEAWLREHTAADAMWWGRALVVEPRYVAAIVAGAQANGLTVRA